MPANINNESDNYLCDMVWVINGLGLVVLEVAWVRVMKISGFSVRLNWIELD